MRTGSLKTFLRFAATLVATAASVSALEAFALPVIQHQPIAYFVPEKRIRLDASMADGGGVKYARVYFKTNTQADFLYVEMGTQPTPRNAYAGTLPAPAAGTSSIEYVFLAVNNADEVVKSLTYTVNARRSNETPSWQTARQEGSIQLWTENPATPAPTASFSDSISMNVTESALRFGAVAGILKGGAAGSSAGASSASTTTTTTTTATAGMGGATLATVAIVGGLALAGAAAAAAGGSGGGSSGGGPSSYACSLRQCARENTTGFCSCAGSANTTCSGIPSSTGSFCTLTPSGGGQVTSCPVGSSCTQFFNNGNFSSNFCSTSC